jgi:hypothetical protein
VHLRFFEDDRPGRKSDHRLIRLPRPRHEKVGAADFADTGRWLTGLQTPASPTDCCCDTYFLKRVVRSTAFRALPGSYVRYDYRNGWCRALLPLTSFKPLVKIGVCPASLRCRKAPGGIRLLLRDGLSTCSRGLRRCLAHMRQSEQLASKACSPSKTTEQRLRQKPP